MSLRRADKMEMTRGSLKRFPTLTWRLRAKITPGTDGNAHTEGVGGEHNDKSKAFFFTPSYMDLLICVYVWGGILNTSMYLKIFFM